MAKYRITIRNLTRYFVDSTYEVEADSKEQAELEVFDLLMAEQVTPIEETDKEYIDGDTWIEDSIEVADNGTPA